MRHDGPDSCLVNMYTSVLTSSQLFNYSANMSSFDSSVNSSTTPSKRYPYARPRRATSRPTPKAALVGESGARFPLQAKKRGHNYSLGSQQIPRIVTTAKPANQTDDIAHQESITSMPSAVDPTGQAPFAQSTAYIPVRLPKVTIPSVDPRAFCYGRLVHVVSTPPKLDRYRLIFLLSS